MKGNHFNVPPNIRAKEPEKWMDPENDFKVPTSQTLLRNLKQQVENASNYGLDPDMKGVSPYEDGFGGLGTSHYRKRQPTKETASSTILCKPKALLEGHSVFDEPNGQLPKHVMAKNFDSVGKSVTLDKAPIRCGHDYIDTGAAHSSLRTKQHLSTQAALKADLSDKEELNVIIKSFKDLNASIANRSSATRDKRTDVPKSLRNKSKSILKSSPPGRP